LAWPDYSSRRAGHGRRLNLGPSPLPLLVVEGAVRSCPGTGKREAMVAELHMPPDEPRLPRTENLVVQCKDHSWMLSAHAIMS
jgi:hypothetical protein